MSPKQVHPDARSLITSIGVLFGLKSIYKTLLCSNTDFFNLLKTPFLLIPPKTQLKVAPFAFNITIFSNPYAIVNKS